MSDSVTRREAEAIAGVSKSTLRKWEREGQLDVVGYGARNAVLYDRDRVIKLAQPHLRRHAAEQPETVDTETRDPILPPPPQTRAATTSGEVIKQVFAMFREGVKLASIVERTGQEPATIRTLYDQWKQLNDLSDDLSGSLVQRIDERQNALHEQFGFMRARVEDLENRLDATSIENHRLAEALAAVTNHHCRRCGLSAPAALPIACRRCASQAWTATGST